jgi:hypothetical protein
VPLFNGKDLSGWKPIGHDSPSAWTIANSVLTGSGKHSLLVSRVRNSPDNLD